MEENNSYYLSFVRSLSSRESYLILDTETSGLKGEIVELTILRGYPGKETFDVVFDSKLKPKSPIEPDSIKIHHITDELCEGNPLGQK